ncbi:YccF family protein [Acetobacter sp. AN02]|uniref:YccF family protein n=1 Tax=Acetobacter sp. AN02 TaxID=2894186 RepID=UPI0024345E70|nr:YccF family protein [Acetobacter sp. AN02]MDG6094180.1 YccF family protein [Acetobacter sp. AN02]
MRFIGNIIWFVFGGWYTSLLWLAGAVVFALSIVGLPLTRAAIELAKMSAWPFGREIVNVRDLDGKTDTPLTAAMGTIGFVVNIVWACTFGLTLFFSHIVAGLLCCLTIIGIPFGLQSFKLAVISLWPVGRRVVSAETARDLRR